ncbi:MAG TPA: PIN domain-containing protein [Pirellulales bacterium]|jgi:predicted nucleic acid-binding protein|nr:PIN domain-containing protein [Pirellulales bacterium]
MTFDDLPAGAVVFLDANLLVYHFAAHPTFGTSCSRLIERIDKKEIAAFTSTHVLSEVAHRLMTYEASNVFGWKSKIVDRLKRHPTEIQKLQSFRQAIERIPQLGIQILTIPAHLVAAAAALSIRYGLLSNDALVVAIMQAQGLTSLASHDADFDRVPGLVRYTAA